MAKRKPRQESEGEFNSLAEQINQRNDIRYWLSELGPQLRKILAPYRAKVFVGHSEKNPLEYTYEERSAGEWPHKLPDEKPSKMKPGAWRRLELARNALQEIRCLEHQLDHGQSRHAAAHAFMFGRQIERLQLAPWMHYIEQGANNTEKLTRPQKQKRLSALAEVLNVLPQVAWNKTTNGINKLAELTGIKQRTLWNYLPLLRSADDSLISELAKITSLSRRDVRLRISRIPASK